LVKSNQLEHIHVKENQDNCVIVSSSAVDDLLMEETLVYGQENEKTIDNTENNKSDEKKKNSETPMEGGTKETTDEDDSGTRLSGDVHGEPVKQTEIRIDPVKLDIPPNDQPTHANQSVEPGKREQSGIPNTIWNLIENNVDHEIIWTDGPKQEQNLDRLEERITIKANTVIEEICNRLQLIRKDDAGNSTDNIGRIAQQISQRNLIVAQPASEMTNSTTTPTTSTSVVAGTPLTTPSSSGTGTTAVTGGSKGGQN
jgi:hypothetical protein